MTLTDFAFLVAAGFVLTGAFLAVALKNVFYNALALILCLFGVACLFIFLNCEFLAIIEVIIYIGAIAVAIIFAIMLSQPMAPQTEPRNPVKIARALVLAALLFGALFRILCHAPWNAADPASGDYGLKAIGESLLSVQVLPFEVISIILLIAIIGALVLSEKKEGTAR